MGIFTRLFKFTESEVHSAVDKLEDPIKMTQQGIRDLKKDLQASMQSLAEVKAIQIRSRREMQEKKDAIENIAKIKCFSSPGLITFFS